jgi:hypothetical protein
LLIEKEESVITAREKPQSEMRKRHDGSVRSKSDSRKRYPGKQVAIIVDDAGRYKRSGCKEKNTRSKSSTVGSEKIRMGLDPEKEEA